MPEILLFGRWSTEGIEIRSPGLQPYIELKPRHIPHSEGRHFHKSFGKAHVNLVERFTNSLMRTEKYTGKKSKSLAVIRDAFELIEQRAKENPVQVLVRAVENAAPREAVTRLRYGGISVPKAVDVSPSRRIDVAIRNMAAGAVKASTKSKKSIADCVASEIMKASKGEAESFAIAKKEEVERIAGSAR